MLVSIILSVYQTNYYPLSLELAVIVVVMIRLRMVKKQYKELAEFHIDQRNPS